MTTEIAQINGEGAVGREVTGERIFRQERGLSRMTNLGQHPNGL
jgi:hypothetical protein